MTTNVETVLKCLPATTREISLKLNLHRKTVVRIIQGLIAAGKVRSDGLEDSPRAGRPAEVYELASVTVSRRRAKEPKKSPWAGGGSTRTPKRHPLMSMFG